MVVVILLISFQKMNEKFALQIFELQNEQLVNIGSLQINTGNDWNKHHIKMQDIAQLYENVFQIKPH